LLPSFGCFAGASPIFLERRFIMNYQDICSKLEEKINRRLSENDLTELETLKYCVQGALDGAVRVIQLSREDFKNLGGWVKTECFAELDVFVKKIDSIDRKNLTGQIPKNNDICFGVIRHNIFDATIMFAKSIVNLKNDPSFDDRDDQRLSESLAFSISMRFPESIWSSDRILDEQNRVLLALENFWSDKSSYVALKKRSIPDSVSEIESFIRENPGCNRYSISKAIERTEKTISTNFRKYLAPKGFDHVPGTGEGSGYFPPPNE
jgi:hypothetical protein